MRIGVASGSAAIAGSEMLAANSVVKRVRFTVISGGKSPRKIRTARAPGHRPEG
jgi:hypothetical protein